MVNRERNLLIGGLDVGLHTSIALLDLDGNIICLDTLVNARNSHILEHITDFGNVMVFSTDREKCPSRVKKLSSALSASILLPAKNMTKKKKRILVADFLEEDIKMNGHEKAALASAIFAYKKFRPNFLKLKDKLEKNNDLQKFENMRRELILKMTCKINSL